ncbi:hypothetical protein [Halobellus rarus]|uniref:MarR family transcriptional regulator n=1 Tax=Halobellus rarus TaxID=1126237 RepID=A0ABD6CSF3_9EURY|nr:hypothetical protein [Halobellus rarus]
MSDDIEEAIRVYLRDGGSATRQTLTDEIDANSTEVSRTLGQLVTRGELEEHPEIEGAFRLVDDR